MILKIHPNAQADIRQLRQQDVNGIGKLLALLQAIQEDQELIDSMNLQGEVFDLDDCGRVNLLRVQSVKHVADIWRLKGWDLTKRLIPYRLLYAFFPAGQYRKVPQIEILAAVERSKYNYEPDHPITKRVLSDYREII